MNNRIDVVFSVNKAEYKAFDTVLKKMWVQLQNKWNRAALQLTKKDLERFQKIRQEIDIAYNLELANIDERIANSR